MQKSTAPTTLEELLEILRLHTSLSGQEVLFQLLSGKMTKQDFVIVAERNCNAQVEQIKKELEALDNDQNILRALTIDQRLLARQLGAQKLKQLEILLKRVTQYKVLLGIYSQPPSEKVPTK